MKVLIIYPPRTYARMPYLAPYLIKGYVEENSQHTVDCIDLNIEQHRATWSGAIFDYLADHSLTSQQCASIEIVKTWGARAYEAMRDRQNYAEDRRKLLSNANNVLIAAEALEWEISKSLGVCQDIFPTELNSWDDFISSYKNGCIAAFLADKLRRIDTESYDIIGFSCSYIEQLVYSVICADEIRKIQPNHSALVIGGSGFTHIYHFTLKDSSFWDYFDYGIPYEGEVTFLELVNKIADKKDNADLFLDNVIFRQQEQIYYNNRIKNRPAVHPVPNFTMLHHNYPTPEIIYPILTSKGCYWGKCAFCTHHEGYGQGYSQSDSATIRDTILHVQDLGGTNVYFVDEALPASRIKIVASLLQSMREQRNDVALRWMAECRVEKYTANASYLRALKQSGCRLLINGMETGSQRLMKVIGKGVDISQAQLYAQTCREQGIQVAWMFFIGFPGETPDEARMTFDLIDRCKNYVDYATVGVFGLERGSPVWNAPEQFGVKEVIGREDPYRVVFDYVLEDGSICRRSNLKEKLGLLVEQYPDHLDIFQRIIERSCALFFYRS